MTHFADAMDLFPVARGDSGALLAAMLESVQTQIDKVCCLRMPVQGENSTFFVKFVKEAVLFRFEHRIVYASTGT